ncbi:GlxA family transcriptional regulator [Agrobacterium rubi]|uniref:GlxA family transcriptional regulator n=1 Tax=Agrobacterium rubi TaxID=28099 RepID=A0AAE7UQ59_9HYPH|nr:GlxA family transcriptional regulator [Agrobacterium rubi]NTE89297.1 GlxA family transcriptional regulator [Agrobacterium rubi]NTF05079.1 GlxA family transcriptional regulator [Agrobacterium rubi]NTF38849.1 GlxA family transcriptional regulator [Agrobacterium rubi]OCJ43116.1 AraC family transcriptional regulator [Agrobacterium rubi]QTF99830.1 GlxA family transcriptional regulator [Agrobacterium rubi]
MPRLIEILSYPDVQLLDVAGPLQVFATANDQRRAIGVAPAYAPVVVGMGGEILTSSGLGINVQPLDHEAPRPDTLIIPGGWGVYDACEDAHLLAWIKARSAVARRTASVCSGAFLLATAGLLNGKRAVTHWQRCQEFKERFPLVRLDPDPIFIRDGDTWTSAGVTAGIDLALAFVEADLGHQAALAVARQLVVFLKRPGGQSQFSTALTLQDNAGRFEQLHAWIMENLHRPLTLPDLAHQCAMSVRSFSRHYRQATGSTPAQAMENLRLETARRLLEQGTSVTGTAKRCGFGAEETMRRAFQRRFAVSPRAYRERFLA